jgi:hypothetical protein
MQDDPPADGPKLAPNVPAYVLKPELTNEPAKTIFVDGFQGIMSSKNTVKINLVQDWPDPNIAISSGLKIENKGIRVVTARLVMDISTFISFRDEFDRVINFMIDSGTITVADKK